MTKAARFAFVSLLTVTLVLALVASVNTESVKEENLDDLLATDDLLQFQRKRRQVQTVNLSNPAPATRAERSVVKSKFVEESEIALFVQEEDFFLPSDSELRHHRRKRQIESEGSGNTGTSVVTRQTMDVAFSSLSSVPAFQTAARDVLVSQYAAEGLAYDSLTVVATDDGNGGTLLTYTTDFTDTGNRHLVAHIFRKYVQGQTISTFSPKTEVSVENAAGATLSTQCFMCPADRPCGSSTTCAAFSTSASTDLFPWGYYTMDERLPHGADVLSPGLEMDFDFMYDSTPLNKVYMGDNGILSFSDASGSGVNPVEVADVGASTDNIICVFCEDADLEFAGRTAEAMYHIYNVGEEGALPILLRATNEIQAMDYSDDADFEASSVGVFTWFDVPYENDQTTASTERNLAQAVVATNGEKSYVILFYSDMGWPSSVRDMITVGFPHLSTSVLTNYMLPKADGDERQSVPFNQLEANTGVSGETGKFILRVGSRSTTSTLVAMQQCSAFYKSNFPNLATIQADLDDMSSCPCSELHTSKRTGTFAQSVTGDFTCYDRISNQNLNSGMRCCYQDGAYTTSTPQTRYLKNRSGLSGYTATDGNPFTSCCLTSTSLCSIFRQVRPYPICTSSSGAASANGVGDPHITTLDGFVYSFNGYGEWRMFEFTGNQATDKFTKVSFQCRTMPMKKADGTNQVATIFTACAGKEEGTATENNGIFHVEINTDGNKMNIYYNPQDVSHLFYGDPNYKKASSNLIMARMGDQVQFTFPMSEVTANFWMDFGTLTFKMTLPIKYKGTTTGLMGNFDGNQNNDLFSATGQTLPSTALESEIYPIATTWATSASNSIMRYVDSNTWSTYNNKVYTPLFFDKLTDVEKQAGIGACGNITMKNCIIDYVATGNAALAQSTSSQQAEAKANNQQLQNVAPTLTGPATIQVRQGVEQGLTFTGTDPDGDAVTYVVIKQPSNGFNFDTVSGSGKWTPSSADPVSIVVSATDAIGMSSQELTVNIVLCEGCQNDGTCNYAATRAPTTAGAPETFKFATCTCKVGWSGNDCSLDLDGCAAKPCGTQRTCTDVAAATQATTGKAYSCGPCPSGYQAVPGTENKCQDVNECTTNNGNCPGNSACINNIGSFDCNCNAGYRKQGTTCEDVNECSDRSDGCQHTCTNSPGTFTCTCFTGFTLQGDGKSCVQATPPASCNGFGCAHICTEVGGSPTCFCRSGYALDADAKSCNDIDECTQGVCSQGCANSAGSFTCSCFDGFELAADGRACTKCVAPKWGPICGNTCECNGRATGCDSIKGCKCTSGWTGVNCVTNVDECTATPNICGTGKICVDTQGSYKCNCPAGYSGDNCQDINECEAETSPCPDNSNCVNTPGSFSCNCLPGFIMDGNVCQDINECDNGQTACQQTCNNNAGSYNCLCEDGYSLNDDRKTCRQLADPCGGQGDCNHYCVLVGTTATCKCNKGYVLNADGKTCDDVNECADNTLNTCTVKSTCNNLAGSFECSCPVGQKLANDGRTCNACDDNHWGPNCANECGCSALGTTTCDKVTGCTCKSGWTGDKCDTDKDECNTETCHANSDCVNLPGTFQCACRSGYVANAGATACTDVNECTNAADNVCAHDCANIDGDYTCSCRSGFVMEGKGACKDIDECALGTSGCAQQCRNTNGGFACECFDGYSVDLTDATKCIQSASAVCDTPKKDLCTQNCRKTGGNDVCFCNSGYELNADGITCDDIKECDLTPPRCSQLCTEQQGSYQCACNAGFKLAADQTTCTACEAGKWGVNCGQTCTCDSTNSVSCNNVDGSCTCRTGWEGSTCTTDVKECTVTPTICGTNGVCTERDGGYSCSCSAGFIRTADACTACDSRHYGVECASTCACDVSNTQTCNSVSGACTCKPEWTGTTCTTDVNECTTSTPCTGAFQTCRNTQGSYECDCQDGYVKDATTGECKACAFGFYGAACASRCPCTAGNFDSCNNINGQCTCKSGWEGTSCETNINECTGTPAVCTGPQETCRDIDGSYACDCDNGYYKAPNSTCIVCGFGKYGANCATDCPCTANQFASCNNLDGTCTCNSGWEGADCNTNVNECLNTASPVCNAAISSCRDTSGSYACDCNSGYTNNAAGVCTDIDECTAGTDNCVYLCNNTAGSFFCSCPTGYTGNGISCTAVFNSYAVTVTYDLNRASVLAGSTTSAAYIALSDSIRTQIDSIVSGIFGDAYVVSQITSLQAGSVIANAELRIDPTQTNVETDRLAAQGIDALANTNSMNIDGTQAPVSKVEFNSTTINPKDSACDVYRALHTLESNEFCQVDSNGLPVIQKLPASEMNLPLILGLTIPFSIIVLSLLAVIIFFCCCKTSKASRPSSADDGRDNVAFRSAFVGNLPTKGNFGPSRYMMYSPHTLSETASQASGEGFKYTRPKTLEGRADFLDMPGPSERTFSHPYTPRDGPFDDNGRSNFSWENMFNVLEPSRNAPFEVPRPTVSNAPNRMYRDKRDSLA